MSTLKTLLADKARAGVYQIGPGTQSIEAAAKEAGLAVWRIDIGHVHDKTGFTALVAKALAFPEWFGGNWDAFEDCLTDMSWHEAPGYVLVLDHSKHFGAGHRHEFDTAMEVLDGAATWWQEQGKPFWALVSGPEGWDAGLPPLPPV